MKRAPLALVILLAASPMGLAAAAPSSVEWRDTGLPAGEEVALTQACAERDIPLPVQQHWVRLVRALHARAIPTDLMGARLLEGLTKEVPVPLLDQALATLSQDLSWAQGLILAHHPSRPPDSAYSRSLAQMEAALRAGLSRTDLARIYGTAPLGTERMTALARLGADVAATQVSPAAVVTPLQQMVTEQWTAARINAVDARFMTALASGATGPTAWTRIVTSTAPEGAPPLSTEIRRSLPPAGAVPFNGNAPMGGAASPMGGPAGPAGGMAAPGGSGMPGSPMMPMGH